MIFDAIDSVFLAAADLDTACRPYERLGLCLGPCPAGRRTLLVGGPENLFAARFLSEVADDSPLAGPLREARAAGRGLFAVGLGVADLGAALAALAARGVEATAFRDGACQMAWLPLHDRAGTDLVLVRHERPVRDRHADALRDGLLAPSFPLKRLDHLAAVTPDLEARTRFWSDILGVPVAGEVATPTMLIRQLRIGDAVLELLGPASADSPLWKRPPGLVSMVSWETEQLDAVAERARAAGFTVPAPAAGVLPGTRTATVPGAELAGVNMQLLEYVRTDTGRR